MDIASKFEELKDKGEKALVLFVSAGDPPLNQLANVIDTLQQGGADIIELGIPFSDPIADGPTIQASSQRALDSGVNPIAILQELRKIELKVPVVLMGYYNPVLRIGLLDFAAEAKKAGASGNIISDLTPEESDDWIEICREEELDTIFLTAPTSTDHRLDEVCKRSTGFVYAVSRTGVTGALTSVPAEVDELVSRIKQRSQLPVCVGFGISKPEHVKTICTVADGAVIGSWLVDLLQRTWNNGAGKDEIIAQLRAMKEATLA